MLDDDNTAEAPRREIEAKWFAEVCAYFERLAGLEERAGEPRSVAPVRGIESKLRESSEQSGRASTKPTRCSSARARKFAASPTKTSAGEIERQWQPLKPVSQPRQTLLSPSTNHFVAART